MQKDSSSLAYTVRLISGVLKAGGEGRLMQIMGRVLRPDLSLPEASFLQLPKHALLSQPVPSTSTLAEESRAAAGPL